MVVEFQWGDWKVVGFLKGGRVSVGRLESGGFFEGRQSFSGEIGGALIILGCVDNFGVR